MDDLISRQAAIDETWKEPSYTDPYNVLTEVRERIQSLSTAQQWIPCSEGLPKARRSVILSTKDWSGEGCYWETTEHHVIWKGYRWNATYWDDEVIAWMPLPEPYKGEES